MRDLFSSASDRDTLSPTASCSCASSWFNHASNWDERSRTASSWPLMRPLWLQRHWVSVQRQCTAMKERGIRHFGLFLKIGSREKSRGLQSWSMACGRFYLLGFKRLIYCRYARRLSCVDSKTMFLLVSIVMGNFQRSLPRPRRPSCPPAILTM